MPKTYPAIRQEEFVSMSRIVQNIEQPPGNFLVSRKTRTTSSSTSPGWPSDKRENSFNTNTVLFETRPVYVDSTSPDGKYRTRNISSISGPSFIGPSNSLKSAVEYKALLRFYGKIPEVTANLALLYAERRKTMESITTALSGILKAVRDVRKGRPPELFMNANQLRNRKRMSGAWLNYTYGIAPFASDLHAISISELQPVIWLKGRAKEEYESTRLDGLLLNRGSYMATFKAGLSLANPLTATLAGAGMTNPALIAWEVTPFSFMADWLLPVGPYLEMLSSTSGYNKHPGSITRGTKEWTIQSKRDGAYAYGESKQISRAVITFPSAPLPRLKNPFSPVHALNALSIIHQFVKEGQR